MPRRRDAVFFGHRPPAATRDAIFELGRTFRKAHALVGPEMGLQTLHLSLHGVAASSDEAAWVVIEACQAMQAVETPAFEVRFNRVISWKGTPLRRTLVLLPDSPSKAALFRLWRDIGATLNAVGLPAARKFEPHITLGRYPDLLPETPVPPINWTVDAFDLVWSHYGQGRHSLLHRTPLYRDDQAFGLSAP